MEGWCGEKDRVRIACHLPQGHDASSRAHTRGVSQLLQFQLYFSIHSNLRNSNLHNVIHSLISWNPREGIFVVQISLLTVTFLSLILRIFVINANHQSSRPTPSHCVMCRYVECYLLLLLLLLMPLVGWWSWGVTPLRFIATCYPILYAIDNF